MPLLKIIRRYSNIRNPNKPKTYANSRLVCDGEQALTLQTASAARPKARSAIPPPKAHQKARKDLLLPASNANTLSFDASHANAAPAPTAFHCKTLAPLAAAAARRAHGLDQLVKAGRDAEERPHDHQPRGGLQFFIKP